MVSIIIYNKVLFVLKIMKSAMIKKYGGPFFYKQCIGSFRTLMYPSPPPLRGTSTSKRERSCLYRL